MQPSSFNYDAKWETVAFEAPAKKIVQFNDV